MMIIIMTIMIIITIRTNSKVVTNNTCLIETTEEAPITKTRLKI